MSDTSVVEGVAGEIKDITTDQGVEYVPLAWTREGRVD